MKFRQFTLLIPIALLFILQSVSTEAQVWEKPLDVGGNYFDERLQDIHFISETKGWAVSESGSVIVTDDGGLSWSIQNTGITNFLEAVYFISEDQGWASGSSGTVITTNDGGETWAVQNTGILNWLRSIFFVSPNVGWAVGSQGVILHTTDGGASWSAQTSGTTNILYSVVFSSPTKGWAVGQNGVIRTTNNGGLTWTSQSSGTSSWLYSVRFLSETKGWAVGADGTIRITYDGGANWSSQISGTTSTFYDVFFINELIGWAGAANGNLIGTEDGGITWELQQDFNNSIRAIHFDNDMNGWIAGGHTNGLHGIVRVTNDGGESWEPHLFGGANILRDVHFVTPFTGWAVSQQFGVILHTADGGASWIEQNSGVVEDLLGVSFASPTVGCIVGGNGTILRTSNGGSTWTTQNSGTSNALWDVYFYNSTTGWAVGLNGTIRRTVNGGSTWTSQSSGTSIALRSVYFISPTEGWVVGGNGTILSTIDGGSTWTPQNSGTTNNLTGVSFHDNTTGWAVGNSGTILKTENGGLSWIPKTSGTTSILRSVSFPSSSNGWISEGSNILSSVDGGESWNTESLPYDAGAASEAVFFSSPTRGWSAGGSDGTILLYGYEAPNPGCMDADACNYNPEATVDDGSCFFIGDTCDDENPETINDVVNDDCECVGDIEGCMDVSACNFNPEATVSDGSCLFVDAPCDDDDPETINDVITAECECVGEPIVEGCMDAEACNFNPDANVSDGSCLFVGESCDDENPETINDIITEECECVGEPIVEGCMDAEACNFNPDANMSDDSCLFVGESCDDNDPETINDIITEECECVGEPIVEGCMDAEACNFNPDANVGDNSCLVIGESCDDNDPETVNEVVTEECECIGELIVEGCMDAEACNFNPDANVSDDSCLVIGESCDDNDPETVNDVVTEDCDCVGEPIVLGCLDIDACNFNSDANVSDDSCLFIGAPCDDNNPETVNDVITDECECEGEPIVLGCMDVDACNFNPDANVDDDSCLFVGDECDDGDPETVMDTINEDCDCVGLPVSVEENFLQSVQIYPNPVDSELKIQTTDGLTIFHATLSDLNGRIVLSQQIIGFDIIHTGHLSNGLYILKLENEETYGVVKISVVH